MNMTITDDLVEAFLKCPTKCFLRSRGEAGAGNAYAAWVRTNDEVFRVAGELLFHPFSPMIPQDSPSCYHSSMRHLVVLFIHFLATLVHLLGPGGVRSIVAESLILKHQLLIVNRYRQRSPNLCTSDRILAGLMALLVRPTRLFRSAIVLKPSTLLGLHKALSKQKYRVLFSPNRRRKPGPERAEHRTHPCSRRNEATESQLGLSANRSTDRLGVPHPNRQRRSSQDSRAALPAGTGLWWSLLADFPGPHKRQSLEH